MKRVAFFSAAILLIGSSAVWADLAAVFDGYTYVQENKMSGLQSDFRPTNATAKLPNSMFTLGPDRVMYPSGIGAVPSPGGAVGRYFDEGALGVRVDGAGNLVVRVADGLNPQTGYYYSGWNTWYGQGDVFITVDDSAGVRNFALLNSWPKDGTGAYRTVDGTNFNQAQAFHTSTYGDLQGHLVSLSANADVVLTGGAGSYNPASPPGMDSRVYAQDGANIGDAQLVHSSTWDWGLQNVWQEFYIQTWTVPLSSLSGDPLFTIGLHVAPSCGNDQIGLVATVPIPTAVLLGMLGLGAAGLKLLKFA